MHVEARPRKQKSATQSGPAQLWAGAWATQPGAGAAAEAPSPGAAHGSVGSEGSGRQFAVASARAAGLVGYWRPHAWLCCGEDVVWARLANILAAVPWATWLAFSLQGRHGAC